MRAERKKQKILDCYTCLITLTVKGYTFFIFFAFLRKLAHLHGILYLELRREDVWWFF